MREGQEPGLDLEPGARQRRMAELRSTGSDLDRKFWVAMALYAVLALLVWFTMGEGKVLVEGRLVELRLVPLVIIGGMALKTVLARHAEKIRRGGEKES
ncbi:MAG: hypothetical protein ABR956_10585 [Terracidiphilus sp.]|jgi:hypothetical protein